MVKIFLFSIASIPTPTQPAIQWLPQVLFLRVKRPESEADYTFPSSGEAKNIGAVPPLLHAS
jgi:hypothetical protein